ncbi:MAG: hypothetical protein WHV66_03070 [Anaerolineales bacterium]
MNTADLLEQIVREVQKGAAYQDVHPGLIRRVAAQMLQRKRNFREVVKATRNKIYQVGGAYFEQDFPYERWKAELATIDPRDKSRLSAYCRNILQQHASTRERLAILETFYETLFEPLAPVYSVLDLACGLNPLALPWMPLAPEATYLACDIYRDMVSFLNGFLNHLKQNGNVEWWDLLEGSPPYQVQVALLLKVIPCLEQLDKNIVLLLLQSIQAEHIVVSFPAHSLGGRRKGMPENYETHFRNLISQLPWQVKRYEFPSELVFVLNR